MDEELLSVRVYRKNEIEKFYIIFFCCGWAGGVLVYFVWSQHNLCVEKTQNHKITRRYLCKQHCACLAVSLLFFFLSPSFFLWPFLVCLISFYGWLMVGRTLTFYVSNVHNISMRAVRIYVCERMCQCVDFFSFNSSLDMLILENLGLWMSVNETLTVHKAYIIYKKNKRPADKACCPLDWTYVLTSLSTPQPTNDRTIWELCTHRSHTFDGFVVFSHTFFSQTNALKCPKTWSNTLQTMSLSSSQSALTSKSAFANIKLLSLSLSLTPLMYSQLIFFCFEEKRCLWKRALH